MSKLDDFDAYLKKRRKLVEQITTLYFNQIEDGLRVRLEKILPNLYSLQNERDLENLNEFYEIAKYIEKTFLQYTKELSNASPNKLGDGLIDEAIYTGFIFGTETAYEDALEQNVYLKELKEVDINLEGILIIQNNTRSYLLELSKGMAERSRQKLIELANKEVFQNINKGEGMKVTSQRLAKQIRENGIKLEDRNGRKLSPDWYAQTVVRTETIKSLNYGTESRLLQNDINYVLITKHRDSCKYCEPLEDKIYCLNPDNNPLNAPNIEEARNGGIFHPNCEHNLAPIIIEFKDEEYLKSKIVKKLPDTGYKRSDRDREIQKQMREALLIN